MMAEHLEMISMNGRMAYVIMCAERFLTAVYPDKDWSPVARKMWKATADNWADWANEYCEIIPDVILSTDGYDAKGYQYISEEEYHAFLSLYDGITSGREDNISDIVDHMLNMPYEMAMVYEGTSVGDGKESLDIIKNTEDILLENNIPLPDSRLLSFSPFSQKNGWGNDFDGERLSVILT